MRLSRALRPLIAVTALALPSAAAHAQRYWHDDQGRDAIRTDVWLPFLKGTDHKFFTGAIVPSVSIRVGDGFRVEGDVPLMRGALPAPTGGKSTQSLRIGNPYLGLRVGDDAKLVSGFLGVRGALAGRAKDAQGQRAIDAAAVANYDDFEAFTPNLLTVRGGVEIHHVSKKGFLVGVRTGPSLQVNTSGNPLADNDTYFDYGFRLGFEGAKALATAALTGRYLLTTNGSQDFADRSAHHLAGTVELRSGGFRPRATLRLPLKKALRDEAGGTLGLGFSLAM